MRIQSTNPNHQDRPRFALASCPNNDGAAIADLTEPDGSNITVTTVFEFGVATVRDDVGNYLIAKGHAKRAGLIRNVLSDVADKRRVRAARRAQPATV